MKLLKALKELRDDVDSHKPEHEALKEDAAGLIDSCQSDKYVAEGEVQDASKRYNALAGEHFCHRETAVEHPPRRQSSMKMLCNLLMNFTTK